MNWLGFYLLGVVVDFILAMIIVNEHKTMETKFKEIFEECNNKQVSEGNRQRIFNLAAYILAFSSWIGVAKRLRVVFDRQKS